MSLLEITAVVFGFVCVWLTIKRSIWCWPTGLIQVALYLYIFTSVQLYSDAILQGIYIPLQIYGWWAWLHGGKNRSKLRVGVLPTRQFLTWTFVGLTGTATLGYLMDTQTDASLPYWDASTTTFSLVAQWLLGRKKLQTWVFWIIVDVIAIGVYATKGLYLTTGLYAAYLVMASAGLYAWLRAIRVATAAAPA